MLCCCNNKKTECVESEALEQRTEEETLQLILASIANGDKETFADLVRYPLYRQYPLRNIYTKDEMVKYFGFLFDDEFRNTIGSLVSTKIWTIKN